jgi:hypothetical protein
MLLNAETQSMTATDGANLIRSKDDSTIQRFETLKHSFIAN